MNEDCFHLGIKAVIRNGQGKVFLLEVNPESLKEYSGPTYWDLPGGRMNRNETVEETLRREITQETKIPNVRIVAPLIMILSKIRIPLGEIHLPLVDKPIHLKDVGLILWLYMCEAPTAMEVEVSDEHLSFQWFTPAEAASLLSVKYPEQATDAIRALGYS